MYNIGDKVIYTNNNYKIVYKGSIIVKTKLSSGKFIYMIGQDNKPVRSVAQKFVSLDKEWYRQQKLNSILND